VSLTATATLHWFVANVVAQPAGGHAPIRRARRSSTTDQRLLSCRQVDALYRMRSGTAAADYHAKRLPGKPRGRAIFVSAKRADELYGVRS
jgi:hypothetical protein